MSVEKGLQQLMEFQDYKELDRKLLLLYEVVRIFQRF